MFPASWTRGGASDTVSAMNAPRVDWSRAVRVRGSGGFAAIVGCVGAGLLGGCALSVAPLDTPHSAMDGAPPDVAIDRAAPRDAAPDREPAHDASNATDAFTQDASQSDVSEGADVPVCASCLLAPRAIAPLSGSIVPTARPAFRWQLAEGEDGATVEVCADRECRRVIASFDASGSDGEPGADIPPGVWFWRLRGRARGVRGIATSPVWEIAVQPRHTPRRAPAGAMLDFNADGYVDLAVAATSDTADEVDVFLGGPGGLGAVPSEVIHGPWGVATGGPDGVEAVTATGDLNGDGYGDLAWASDAFADQNDVLTTVIYVHLGGPQGCPAEPSVTLPLPHAESYAQIQGALAGIGDVNADGYADLAINFGWSCTNVGDDCHGGGGIGIYLGGPNGPGPEMSQLVVASAIADPDLYNFGYGIVAAGDLNNDGYDDVLVSDPRYGQRETRNTQNPLEYGRAYLFTGTARGITEAPVQVFAAPDGVRRFGRQLAAAGDVDDDGDVDVVIGGIPDSHNDARGFAFVFTNTPGGITTLPSARLELQDLEGLSAAGDFDGDGIDDLAVYDEDPVNRSAEIDVFRGTTHGLDARPAVSTIGSWEPMWIFSFLSAGRDLNGDGMSDVVLGGPAANGQDGTVMIAFGNRGTMTDPLILADPAGHRARFGFYVTSGLP